MELKDIVGPWYPCNHCWMAKEEHGEGEGNWIKHDFIPAPIDKVINLEKVLCSPLQDIASRLKAL